MRHRQAIITAALALTLGTGSLAVPAAAFAGTADTAGKAGHAATVAHVPNIKAAVSYPFAKTSPTKIDPWGAEVRQCTSYASWYLASQGVKINRLTGISGPRGHATLGNAAHWDSAARQAGYQISSKPVVGAIAQWRADERSTWRIHDGYSYVQAEGAGHVAVVRKVFPDGTALIQDYNGAVPLGLHEFRGKAPRYLLLHP